MNPVFWFLIIVAAFCLWLAISFIFIPLGGILLKMMKRIFNIINHRYDCGGCGSNYVR